MRTLLAVLFVGVFVFVSVPAASASSMGFFISRTDSNGDGVAESFAAEINISNPNVSSAQLVSGANTTDFVSTGAGQFTLKDTFASLDALNSGIGGTHNLRLTHSGGVTEYSATFSAATAAMFPAIATLDAVTSPIAQQYTFTWSWSGTADGMGVGASLDAGMWVDDDSLTGTLNVGTTRSFSVDFAPLGGHGQFDVGYGYLLNPLGTDGPISNTQLVSGNYLPFDSMTAIISSDAEVDFTMVPEPATMLLLGAGLAGLLRRRRN